ncbi:hypothetical protein [Chishuiella sp.]|uniref:hypothetical protein n=1 Tax=Chishuiella sp. TaxID=1969467 RepID=UPI0028AB50A4|nr:hypothetical protein [Chishuiella sp.]
MKKFLILMITFTSFINYSCSDDDKSDIEQTSIKTEQKLVDSEIYTFSYKDKVYSSPILSSKNIENNNDIQDIVLEDKRINEILQDLLNNPNSAMYINDLGKIYFFDSYKELINSVYPKSNLESPRLNSKIAANDNKLVIYDDEYYRGSNSLFTFSESGLDLVDLGPYGFHDRISSFTIDTNLNNVFAITFFRDQNYGGRSLTFNVGENLKVATLKNYRLSKKAGSWNKQATSLRVFKR